MDLHNSVWRRPIALLVKREHTACCFSDACGHAGLGGWSDSSVLHCFMWCLCCEDLLDCGFDLTWLTDEETVNSQDPDCLHINILELIAIIINIWLTIVFISAEGSIPGGNIISFLADNTQLCRGCVTHLALSALLCVRSVASLWISHYLVLSLISCQISLGRSSQYWGRQIVTIRATTQGRREDLGLRYSSALPTQDLLGRPSISRESCYQYSLR